MREDVIKRVFEKKIIAIVRGVYGDDAVKLAHALYQGGIDILEVTFDQSRPDLLDHTSDTVKALVDDFKGKMLFGAGTVTSLDMLTCAYDSGAQFVVSPDVNEEVIRRTRELGLVSMPGAMTPTEIMTAYRFGADFVKVFPAANLGTSYIKAIRAPINHIPLLGVGGINDQNISEFISAGMVGAGVGGNLVNKEWIKNGEFEKITALAQKFVNNLK